MKKEELEKMIEKMKCCGNCRKQDECGEVKMLMAKITEKCKEWEIKK